MDFETIIASIKIFRKYADRPHFQDGFHAEQQEVLAGLTVSDTKKKDKVRLKELGWYRSDLDGESWAHYARL